MQLVCPACSALNNVPADKPALKARCGKCQSALFGGRPMEVNQVKFDRFLNKSELPIVVDFWAPWCGPCQSMAPVYESVAKKFEARARLLKVNTEVETALSSRFNIRSIPTLMIFCKAQEVARVSGALDNNNLQSWINQHI